MDLADRWNAARSDSDLKQFSPEDVKSFSTEQKVVFFDRLESFDPLSSRAVTTLDEAYGIHKTDNAEIRLRFYRIALLAGKEYAEDAACKTSPSHRRSGTDGCSLGDQQGPHEVLQAHLQAAVQADSRAGPQDLPRSRRVLCESRYELIFMLIMR